MDALLARGEPVRMVNRSGGAPYDQWEEQFPRLQAGVLAAAPAHSARLVSMENVDMYGRPNGQPLTETRAHRAHTHQGRLRSRMSNELLSAHQSGRVEVTIGRAADYYGPRGGAQSNRATGWCRPRSRAGRHPCWVTPTSRTPTLIGERPSTPIVERPPPDQQAQGASVRRWS